MSDDVAKQSRTADTAQAPADEFAAPSRRTLATLYGAGLSPKAPGTVGSLVAAVLAYAMLILPYGWFALVYGTVAYTILGTRSATRYMDVHHCEHDPKEIVVDELAGQWLTYLVGYALYRNIAGITDQNILVIVNAGGSAISGYMMALALYIFLGFLCFRLFDIVKPWPISLADRKVHGGWGVMFDDLLAAIPAGILCSALYHFLLTYLATY